MFASKKKRLERLRLAIAALETTAADDLGWRIPYEALRRARFDVIMLRFEGPEYDHALDEAEALLEVWDRRELAAKHAGAARRHAVEDRHVRPCTQCGCCDLAIRDGVTVETRGTNLDCRVIVCTSCGDLRLAAATREGLARWLASDELRLLTVDEVRGPYRR